VSTCNECQRGTWNEEVTIARSLPSGQRVRHVDALGDNDQAARASMTPRVAKLPVLQKEETPGTIPHSYLRQALEQAEGVLNSPRANCLLETLKKPRSGCPLPSSGPATTPPVSPPVSPPGSPRPAEEGKRNEVDVDYVGHKVGNAKHGSGRLRMGDCVYDGDFKDDYKHGVGMLTWDDGRRYHGQFAHGRFSGNAVMSWPDGRRYFGQYAEDVKHGEGTFTWADGRRYQGQWRAGKRDGIGVYTTAKGDTRTGLWQVDRPITWDSAEPVSRAKQPPCMERVVDGTNSFHV